MFWTITHSFALQPYLVEVSQYFDSILWYLMTPTVVLYAVAGNKLNVLCKLAWRWVGIVGKLVNDCVEIHRVQNSLVISLYSVLLLIYWLLEKARSSLPKTRIYSLKRSLLPSLLKSLLQPAIIPQILHSFREWLMILKQANDFTHCQISNF